ncbi:MAG TPA: hypothetical protein DDY20_00155 [Desulfobulbaceae bacterium]|nr:hypothetical protein [Desulfobulbaceae bacterium]
MERPLLSLAAISYTPAATKSDNMNCADYDLIRVMECSLKNSGAGAFEVLSGKKINKDERTGVVP